MQLITSAFRLELKVLLMSHSALLLSCRYLPENTTKTFLDGLDFLMAELAKRDMKAILFLE